MSDTPYPGLRPFDTKDASNFFGREKQVDELIRVLSAERFVTVSGMSGSGKSSLVRAGLIPALKQGLLPVKQHRWKFVTMMPGTGPMAALRQALADEGIPVDAAPVPAGQDLENSQTQTEMPNAEEQPPVAKESAGGGATVRGNVIEAGGSALVKAVQAAIEKAAPSSFALFLLVDQFEDIFRYAREASSDEAGMFIDVLIETTRQTSVPIYVVLTMRSDFVGDCARFRGLPELVNRTHYLVPRMSNEDMEKAIRTPAERSGAKMEDRLVDRLLNDVGDDPDRLPLLQHVLSRTWKSWEAGGKAGAIDLDHYRATGTINGEEDGPAALAAEGLEVLEGLQPKERNDAEVMFRIITDRSPGGRDTRRPCDRPNLARIMFAPADASKDWTPGEAEAGRLEKVISSFRDCSFLRPAPPAPAAEMIDLTHEALMKGWGDLQGWMEVESKRVKDWLWLVEMERRRREDRGRALQGGQIRTARALTNTPPFNRFWTAHVTGASREDTAFDRVIRYIESSEKEEDANAKNTQRRMRISRRLGTAAVILLFAFGITATVLWLKAKRATTEAIELKGKALNAQREAVGAADDANRAKQQLASVVDVLKKDTKKAVSDIRSALDETVAYATDAEKQLSGKLEAKLPGDDDAKYLDRFLRNARDRLKAFEQVAKEKSAASTGVDQENLKLITALYESAQTDVNEAAKQLEKLESAPSVRNYVDRALAQRESNARAGISKANNAIATAAQKMTDPKLAQDAIADVASAEIANLDLQDRTNIPLHSFVPPETGSSQIEAVKGETEKLRARLDQLLPSTSQSSTQLDERPIDRAAAVLKHRGAVNWLEFFPSASRSILLATAGEDGFVTVWNGKGEPVFSKRAAAGNQGVNEVAIDQDGLLVAAASNGSTVRIYNLGVSRSNPPATAFEENKDSVTSVAFRDDSIVASASADRTVRVFRPKDGKPIQANNTTGDIVTFVRFRPDGKYLVSSCDDKFIRIHNLDNGTFNKLGDRLDGPVRRAQFSGDGKWVVASAVNSSYVCPLAVEPWQTAIPFKVNPIKSEHPQAVLYSAFRPTASGEPELVVTCCANGQIRLWNFKKEKLAAPLEVAHRGRALFADWSKDGQWLVTCGDDGAFILWDCRGEKPVPRVRGHGHNGHATFVRLSPDAKWVATAGDDNQAVLWNLEGVTVPAPRVAEPPPGKVWLEFGVTTTNLGPDGKWVKREEANWKTLNDRLSEFKKAAREDGVFRADELKLGRWIIDIVDDQGKSRYGPQHTMILEPGFESINDDDLRKLKTVAQQMKFGTTPSAEGVNPKWTFLERIE